MVHGGNGPIFIANGPIPAEVKVRHTCDNPPCCNPKHLLRGSQLDNIRDRVARGRNGAAHVEANGSAKLTVAQVKEIRALRGTVRRVDLAARYDVEPSTISAIWHRKIWETVE